MNGSRAIRPQRLFQAGEHPPNFNRTFPAEILTGDEVRRLISLCSNRAPTGIRNRALLVALYRGGLRIGEALALKAGDIDTSAGTVRVLHGKGDRLRVVGLDPGAMAVVERWLERRRALGLRTRYVFCTLAGDQVDPADVRKLLRRLAPRAGIEKRVHPHMLRHTHAAELAMEGTPMHVIREQLGHTSLAVTDRYLKHVLPAEVVSTMQRRRWEL